MLDLYSKPNHIERRAWRKVSMKRKEKKNQKVGGKGGLNKFLEGPPSPHAKPAGQARCKPNPQASQAKPAGQAPFKPQVARETLSTTRND